MTRQAVTKHLAVLEEANLVVTIWRGREKLHYLNPGADPRDRRSAGSASSSGAVSRVLAELKKRLEGETDG